MAMADVHIPADYAIDALCMEAERRRKQMGLVKYGYGQLVADTTRTERELIAEKYREDLIQAQKKGKYRVSAGRASMEDIPKGEAERNLCHKLESDMME